jgi:hypothetical protein
MMLVLGGKVANPIKILGVNYDSNELALTPPMTVGKEFIRPPQVHLGLNR